MDDWCISLVSRVDDRGLFVICPQRREMFSLAFQNQNWFVACMNSKKSLSVALRVINLITFQWLWKNMLSHVRCVFRLQVLKSEWLWLISSFQLFVFDYSFVLELYSFVGTYFSCLQSRRSVRPWFGCRQETWLTFLFQKQTDMQQTMLFAKYAFLRRKTFKTRTWSL
jgi:hypothetical protein